MEELLFYFPYYMQDVCEIKSHLYGENVWIAYQNLKSECMLKVRRDLMKISQKDYDTFMEWAQQYFITAREAKVKQVVGKFSQEYKTAAKRMAKHVKKNGLPAYIGRHIFRNTPWLKSEKGKWRVHSDDDYCAYCLNKLDEEIYLFDLNDHYYCNYDCMEEMFSLMSDLEDDEETEHLAVEVEEPWDSFWSDCIMLFYDFENLKPEASEYLETKTNATAENHLEVLLLIEKIESAIYGGDYDSVWMNGGYDGPSSWHTYRMLQSLERDLIRLKELEEKLNGARNKKKFLYHISIDETSFTHGYPPSMFQKLRHKYRDGEFTEITPLRWEVGDEEIMRFITSCFREARIRYSEMRLIYCHLCDKSYADCDTSCYRGKDGFYYCVECYRYYSEQFGKYKI
jgi:hypothetical protein